MSATSISSGLLIVLFTIWLFYSMRNMKPRSLGTDHRGCARLAD